MSRGIWNMQNDSRLGNVVDKLLKLIVLNILWMVCSTGVITVGASCTALHYALRKYVAGEDGIVKAFFKGFKDNFGKATALWCGAVFVGLGIFLSYRIAGMLPGTASKAVMVFCAICGFMLMMVLVYVFPILAGFSVGAGEAVSNAILLSVAYLPRTILLIVVNLVPVIVFMLFPGALIALLFVWVPVGFSVTALTAAGILDGVFSAFENKE